MIVESLRVANVRAIEQAEFNFLPGFNLVVGINGVGKTSVLDALGTCISAISRHINASKFRGKPLSSDDIRVGSNALEVQCDVWIGEEQYSYLIHKPRESSIPQKKKAGMPRHQVHATPEISEFIGTTPPKRSEELDMRALGVLYSTNRAVPSKRSPRRGVAAGDVTAAFVDAFVNRELRLSEFAAWVRAQESLRRERPAAGRVLESCERSVARFLPGYENLRVDSEGDRLLVIDRGTTTIPLKQLSDGERGILALVLDLTRRLAQANPELTDPTMEAAAVVLIDEIELHLHPRWQRQVVHNLTMTFPLCQFIATTHSPQIIGEVPHDRIQIMSDGQVYRPSYSLGVDSSRILEEIMRARPRARVVEDLLADASKAIGVRQFKDARQALDQLAQWLDTNDPEVTRLTSLIEFLESA